MREHRKKNIFPSKVNLMVTFKITENLKEILNNIEIMWQKQVRNGENVLEHSTAKTIQ